MGHRMGLQRTGAAGYRQCQGPLTRSFPEAQHPALQVAGANGARNRCRVAAKALMYAGQPVSR